MNNQIENLFETKIFEHKGQKTIIHSETSKDQCLFIQKLISEHNCKNSIEIGLAYGISTLAIIEAVQANGGNKHIVIDKFQELHWKNVGLDILESAGYKDKFVFHEDYCFRILSDYIQQNAKFDFAYVDTTKLFDWILVDFFLLDKLIETNGIIVFDDVNFPSIRKVLRLVSNLPNYKIIGQFPANKKNIKRQALSKLIKLIPYYDKVVQPEIIKTDYDLGISSNCIAVLKVKNDDRYYNWHVPF